MAERACAPDGCEDRTIPASGGQSRPVAGLPGTPSMSGRSTERKPGKAESGEWAALHD